MSFNFSISALRASGMTTYAVQSQLSQLGIPDDIIEQADTPQKNIRKKAVFRDRNSLLHNQPYSHYVSLLVTQ